MIRDIDTFRSLIPTVTGSSITKYLQPIADAESWFISRIVGRNLFEKINGLDHAEPDPLYRISQTVIAYKAYILAIPKMDVLETNNGFAVINDGKLAPASKDRVAALTLSMQNSLSFALYTLFEYLEDTSEYADIWKASPSCTMMCDSYLPTLRLFRSYCPFAGDHLEFIAAKPLIRGLIVKVIEPKISRELSDEIISQINAGSLSEGNKEIVNDLRYALGALYNKDADLANDSLCRVRETLIADPDKFPTFKNSSLYRKIIADKPKTDNPSILSLI